MNSYTKYSKYTERYHLKVVPSSAVFDLIKNELPGSKGVHELQSNRSHHSADERLPHGFIGKVVRELLQAEENTTDGRAKSHGDPGSRGGREDLSFSSCTE